MARRNARPKLATEFSGAELVAEFLATLAALALQECEAVDSESHAKKNVVKAIENVAERLGNTPSVCRKCYVHPAVIESYLDGTMLETLRQIAQQEMAEAVRELKPEEAAVIGLLQWRLAREAEELKKAA